MSKILVIDSCSECPHRTRLFATNEHKCTCGVTIPETAGLCWLHESVAMYTPALGIPDWCPLPDAAPLIEGNRVGSRMSDLSDPTINGDGISKDDLIGGNS